MKSILTIALLFGFANAKVRDFPMTLREQENSQIEKTHAKLVRGPITPVGSDADLLPVCLFKDDDN